jgi:2-polyprenyl-6-methoxyphenol hydroxylase-like FAD-dependent oxidoreductase
MDHHIPTQTDVLIVGAGPTGVTLAVSLAQLGVDYVIVDKLPSSAGGTRAASMQPRTLEYLRRLGLADTMIADGLKGRGFAMADLDRELFRVPYDTIDSPYPFLLMIGQWQTQANLERRLHDVGGAVLRGVRLLDLQDEFPGSAATVVDPDGQPHVINARYVAGCDGLHSRVRTLAGIGFPGDSPGEMFAVADIRFDGWPSDRIEPAYSLSPHGMLITSPLPGDVVRVVASVPPGTAAPTASDVAELIQARGPSWMRSGTVGDVVSSSVWRVYERVASKFRHGNTFLLGDAAHTHSPAGGQGMNTGIQDAGNLAWKLAHVLAGDAPDSLLDTYEAERRPNAQQLIQFTHQIVKVATISDPDARRMRNEILAAAQQVPGVTEMLSRRLSQIDIGYGATDEPFSPGSRVNPDLIGARDLSWSLLCPAGPPPGLPSTFTVEVSSDMTHPVVVRPDGIVAGADLVSELFGFDLNPEGVR